MDISTISAGYTSLKAAVDTIRAVTRTEARIEADGRVIQALEQLGKAQETFMDMRGAIYELQEENRTLKDQLRNQVAWAERASKYELVTTAGSAVVYRCKEPPEHYACTVCYETQRIQILQNAKNMAGSWRCPSCNANYPVDGPPKMRPLPPTTSR